MEWPVACLSGRNHRGNSRRLRLVLTSQTLLYPGEKLLLSKDHPVHGSGLLFGYAADRGVDPDWLLVPDGGQPHARLLGDAVAGSTPQGGEAVLCGISCLHRLRLFASVGGVCYARGGSRGSRRTTTSVAAFVDHAGARLVKWITLIR